MFKMIPNMNRFVYRLLRKTTVLCSFQTPLVSVKKKSNISSETAETVNFHFSHYKSMGTLSCHSNQNSYPTRIKNTTYIEATVLLKHVCQVSSSSTLWFLRRILKNFTKIDAFCQPRQLIKCTYLDKSCMKRRGLLNIHFYKKKSKETEKIVNFLFPL